MTRSFDRQLLQEKLVQFIRELTFTEEEITGDSKLFEELGLDSLSFLDLMFQLKGLTDLDFTADEVQQYLLLELSGGEAVDITNKSPEELYTQYYSHLTVDSLLNMLERLYNDKVEGKL
jgi:acyl carrier protein